MSGAGSATCPLDLACSLALDSEDPKHTNSYMHGTNRVTACIEPQSITRPEDTEQEKFGAGCYAAPSSSTGHVNHMLDIQSHAANLSLPRPLCYSESEINVHATPRESAASTTNIHRPIWAPSGASEPISSHITGDLTCDLGQRLDELAQTLPNNPAHGSAGLSGAADSLQHPSSNTPVLADLTTVPISANERSAALPPVLSHGSSSPSPRREDGGPSCSARAPSGAEEEQLSEEAAAEASPDVIGSATPLPPSVSGSLDSPAAVPTQAGAGQARGNDPSDRVSNGPAAGETSAVAVEAAVKGGPEPSGSDVESLTIACDPGVFSLSSGCTTGTARAPTEDGEQQAARLASEASAVDTGPTEASSQCGNAADPGADEAAELPTIGAVLLSGDRLLFRCAQCGELCATAGRLRAHHLQQHVPPDEVVRPVVEGPRRRGRPPRVASASVSQEDGAGEVMAGHEPEDGVRRTRSGRARASPTPVSLKCETCGKVLSSANKLAVHQRMHSGERPHVCTYCPKRCNDLGNLRKHEQLHFKARPFRCGTCGVTFWTALRQRAHRCKLAPASEVSSTTTANAALDLAATSTTLALAAAPATAPGGTEGAPDIALGDVGTSPQEAAPLLPLPPRPTARAADDQPAREGSPEPNVHSGLVPLVPVDCDVCGRRLRSVSGWQRHRRLHAGVRPYQCRFCDKTCNDSGNMRKHEAGHFKERPYRCDTCCITFINAWRLGLHVCKLRADGGAVGSAASAPAPVPSAAAAAVEVEAALDERAPLPVPLPRGRHAPPPQLDARGKRRDHVCPVCGKALLSYASLEMHYRTHTGEKPFQCDECGKRFSIQGNLVVHTRIHTGERPFQCEECGKMFMYQSHLKVHKRAHSGARPYRCQFCQKGFAASSSRRVHEDTVHSNERKFICETCGAAFKEKKHLKRHSWKKHQAEQEAATA